MITFYIHKYIRVCIVYLSQNTNLLVHSVLGTEVTLKISNTNSKNRIYIGDHRIDIEAGKNAKMITGAAAYGYIPLEDDASNWGAKHIFLHAKEIEKLT